MSGLYIVATPIGNLKDISSRALEVLSEVDGIYAEDTRTARKLLAYFSIKTKLTSLHKFKEKKLEQEVLNLLRKGKKIALVSEAGTPGISDPGASLVRAAHQHHLKVYVVPGPSALCAAISASGFEPPFHFWGFLAGKNAEKFLAKLAPVPGAHFFFVAPHDLEQVLQTLVHLLPATRLFLAKEMTKFYEAYFFGAPQELIQEMQKQSVPLKGEWVLGIEELTSLAVSNMASDLRKEGLSQKQIVRFIHHHFGLSYKNVYNLLEAR